MTINLDISYYLDKNNILNINYPTIKSYLDNKIYNLNKINFIGNINEIVIINDIPNLSLKNVICNKIIYKEQINIKNHILPKSLKVLDCSNNYIYDLPVIYNIELEELYCFNNNINYLIKLPKSLKILDCSKNNISKIYDQLPYNLKYMNLSN